MAPSKRAGFGHARRDGLRVCEPMLERLVTRNFQKPKRVVMDLNEGIAGSCMQWRSGMNIFGW